MFLGPKWDQKPRRREVTRVGSDSRLWLQKRTCWDG